jgi:ADP-ribose pyrophosphatase YjhB (NUDIX family)
MKERYKLIPEVFLLLVVDETILLSRRFQTGYQDGNYGLPGGHGENNETMREGVAREALEEIGIEINTHDLACALVQHRWCGDPGSEHARIGFYFTVRKWKGEIYNREPNKCDDLRWFSFDALPNNIVAHVGAAIHSYREGASYAEYAWPTQPTTEAHPM